MKPGRALAAMGLTFALLAIVCTHPARASSPLDQMEWQRQRLDSGPLIAVAHIDGYDTVAIEISFSDPEAQRYHGKSGTARFVHFLLAEWGPDGDYEDWQETLGDLGGEIFIDAYQISAVFPRRSAEEGIDLLAEAVSQDELDPAAFGQALDGALIDMRTPPVDVAQLGALHLRALGRRQDTTGGQDYVDLGNLSLRDATSWLRTHIRPERANIAVAGDVETAKLSRWTSRAFGDWRRGPVSPEAPRAGERAGPDRPLLRIIEMPGLSQSHLTGFMPVDGGDWNEVLELWTLSNMLGKGESSWLYQALRSDEGISYAPWARMAISITTCERGLMFGLNADPEQLSRALDLAKTTLTEGASRAPSTEELDRALGLLPWSSPVGPREVTSFLTLHNACGPEGSSFQDALGAAAAIVPGDLASLAKRALNPERLIATLVTPPSNADQILPDWIESVEQLRFRDTPCLDNVDLIRWIQDAEDAMEAGDLEHATRLLTRAAETRPDAAIAQLHAGEVWIDARDAAEAARFARRALEVNPSLSRAKALLAEALLQDPEARDEGLVLVEELLSTFPDNHRIVALQADYLSAGGDDEAAVEAVREFADEHPDRPRVWQHLGELLYDRTEDYEAAADAYRRALEQDPGNHVTWAFLGAALRELEEYDESIEHFRKATELEPQFGWAWAQMGDVFRRHLGELDQAIASYDRWTELESGNPMAWIALERTYAQMGSYDEAVDTLLECMSAASDTPWRSAFLITSLGRIPRVEPAVRILEKIPEVAPEFAWTWIDDGFLLHGDLRDDPRMIPAYEAALERSPSNPVLWSHLGDALVQADNDREAAGKFARAVGIKPDYVWALGELGDTLNDGHEDYAGAIDAYEKALELDPENGTLWAHLGNSLKNAGRPREAVDAFRKGLELEPAFAWAWRRLGDTYHDDLDRYEEGIAAYEKAVKHDPRDHRARTYLGVALASVERYDSALASLRKGVELKPDYAWGWRKLGNALKEGPELYEEAIDAYRKALEHDPEDHYAWSLMAGCLAELGRLEEAATAYEKAVALEPTYSRGWSRLSDVYYEELGDADRAVSAWRLGVKTAPGSAQIQNNAAWFLTTDISDDDPSVLPEALELARRACELSEREDPSYLDTLAEILFRMGRVEEAVRVIDEAIALEPEDLPYYEEQRRRFLGSPGSAAPSDP
jgi:tetratricopeptide (TPR) repeat protein